MKNMRARRLGVAAAAALLTGSVLAGAAYASTEGPAPSGSTSATLAEVPEDNDAVQVEREHGIVLEGTAEVDGVPVMLTVYENARYGNSIQVVVGDPEDDNFGSVEQAAPFVVDGVLDATVTVGGEPLRVSGTVVAAGKAERVTESLEDAGMRIVNRGTNQPLAVDADVTYAGSTAAASFGPAFAYDLEVRKVQLYGGATG